MIFLIFWINTFFILGFYKIYLNSGLILSDLVLIFMVIFMISISFNIPSHFQRAIDENQTIFLSNKLYQEYKNKVNKIFNSKKKIIIPLISSVFYSLFSFYLDEIISHFNFILIIFKTDLIHFNILTLLIRSIIWFISLLIILYGCMIIYLTSKSLILLYNEPDVYLNIVYRDLRETNFLKFILIIFLPLMLLGLLFFFLMIYYLYNSNLLYGFLIFLISISILLASGKNSRIWLGLF